jgi:23S rRNA (cytosine1962-C5)-methyltransferase
MSRRTPPPRLRLSPDALRPVAQGHPWVYADGLLDDRPPPGTAVQLVDGRGRPVAFGLADDGPIAVRVLDRHGSGVARLLGQRIAAAQSLRERVLPPQTTAYRLLNGAGDGLPGLVVDRYGAVLVVRVYGACWEPWLDSLTHHLSRLAGVRTVLRRLGVRRVDGEDGVALLSGPQPEEPLVVTEAGLRFLVRPSVGQKTGLFLDQREHRMRVGRLARGQELINLFAYTGGFSVHAAAGGATRVTTVDVAEPALEDARENFRLNGFDPDKHVFLGADAFAWSPERPAGVVVVDPPNLSHDRGADQSARSAYRDLAAHTGTFVEPGGLMATASCTARLSFERWEEAVRDGLRRAGRWSWLWRAGEPPDHPVALAHGEGRYLKFALLHRHPGAGGRRTSGRG